MVRAVAHEVGLVVVHVEAVLINHKDLNHLTLITQKTTITELKNETKNSGTKKGKSLANRKVILLIGKKAEVVSEAGAQKGVVVALTEEVEEAVAVVFKIAQNKDLYLTQRTVTSR